MPEQRRVTIDAFAKVNLGLEVLGRRPDGYHELVTVFQMVGLADTVTVSTGEPGLRVVSSGDFRVPDGDDHLCAKAARAYCDAAGIEPAVHIECQKRIPIGAGLGGGSSDAAATLQALEQLLGAGVGLHAAAAEIGSDVAFFLQGGTGLGTGRGEQLRHIELTHETRVVLVKPEVSVSTRAAYRSLTPDDYGDGSRTRELFERLGADKDPLAVIELMTNSFSRPVEAAYPEVAEVRLRLGAAGAECAMLSGSGSCVFGLFADAGLADKCADELSASGYWTYSTKMIHYVARTD